MRKLTFRTSKYSPPKYAAATLFFVASFTSRRWMYAPFFRTLNKLGFTVYCYDYRSRPLLYATPQQWIDFSSSIVDDISSKIEKLKLAGQNRFGIIGVSVGSTIALHAAKKLSDLERAMLIGIYGSQAVNVWEHKSLGFMRNYFESRNISPAKAYEMFGELEPTFRLDSLGRRPLLIFASKTDPTILFSNTMILLAKAKAIGVDHKVYMIKTKRHRLTNLKSLRKRDVWQEFLNPLLQPKV